MTHASQHDCICNHLHVSAMLVRFHPFPGFFVVRIFMDVLVQVQFA
jgi:hypothetical protein